MLARKRALQEWNMHIDVCSIVYVSDVIFILM